METEETIRQRRHRLATVPRACEACKIRKIRCDRSNPCSNCRASGLTCQNPTVPPENQPKQDRIAHLEKEVNQLKERLSVVEAQLTKDRQRPNAKLSASHDHPVNTSPAAASPAGGVYQGHSSFGTQSVQAGEVAQQIVGAEVPQNGLNLDSSFLQISDVLQPNDGFTALENYQLSNGPSSRRLPEFDPLPSEIVIAILQEMKVNRPIFLCSYVINDPELLEKLCQSTYFPISPPSLGQITAMYGLLFCLLKEYIAFQHPLSKKYDLAANLVKCERNFTAGIETYDMMAVPSFENVLSLALGTFKAQEDGKPLLCCSLLSAAASHCRMLGYSRQSTYNKYDARTAENIKRVFWTLYTFDKNLSLLEGRVSYLQDCEIELGYPECSPNPAFRAWDESFVAGIKLAQLQGQIFHRLYLVGTLRISAPQRAQDVDELANDLRTWYSDLGKIEGSGINHPQVYELSRRSWDIMYYSTLTLVLRATSLSGAATELNTQCFQAARSALSSHLTCFGKYESSESPGLLSESDYANWVLHSASFTPFLVIFVHAIAATSIEDVNLLDEVVEALRRIRKTSQASERLYTVCATFSRLGRGLVEARKANIGMYNQQEDSLRLDGNSGGIFTFGLDSGDDVGFTFDFGDQLNAVDAGEVSALLNEWADGQSSIMTILGTNFGGH
ncbi:hypothetical protein B0T10DRAFT_537975 [Thelonectria olida]|uniref:Zn(2)-C6 fungal-type domain-containing protein n=1 Tax=Thelonectria olida TaxID=1576542 RepID=A0A9P9AQP0_9HYPO|nr:hypothetical protein B0T10DRAFT_537975 [Thelonectria olida]